MGLSLWPRHLDGLHGRVLFLEPCPKSFRRFEVLVHTPHDAALLSRDQRLCCEIVDTILETSLDQFGIHLRTAPRVSKDDLLKETTKCMEFNREQSL